VLSERYLTLVTSEHAGNPKFKATVAALLKMLDGVYNLAAFFDSEFDVDYAVGAQLDIDGDIVGRAREIETEITGVYFAWNTEGVGWNKGVWRGRLDPETGLSLLPDDFYRLIIKAKIAANQWDGTVAGAYDIYDKVFEYFGGRAIIQDNQDMSMSVGVVGLPDTPVTRALLKLGYLFVKPAGVRIEYYLYTSDPSKKLFAWNVQSGRLGGWNEAAWGNQVTV
jgi:hypothetical protein